ncbi:unnamed protein product [Rhodiola kirilowii]
MIFVAATDNQVYPQKMATLSLTSTSATLNAFPICSSSDIPSISSPLSHRTANFFHTSSSSTATTTTAPLSAVSVSSLSRRIVICQVALRSESESSAAAVAAVAADEEVVSKVGSRVRVKVPLKVYHVPKVAEIDLTGKEGVIKQYVGVWKGKRISANLPFKVEFHAEVPERGVVKFFAHLREDEFEYVG